MLYFDTSYLVRLYTSDTGWEKVRTLASRTKVACCTHGRAETVAAFHRKFREGVITPSALATINSQFENDCNAAGFHWLPLSPNVLSLVASTYLKIPANVALRASDAIHLGCAASAGFERVYSNDKRLLEAALFFGLSGENVI